MRLKAGRPDLADYARYFDAPDANADAPLTVTWAGVTTLLVDDGSSALMTDGFFSRPGLAAVGLGQIAPSAARIDGSLERLGVHGLEAVLPVHTHFDHAMDSAVVAQRTGARIVGGESAAQVGIGGGLPQDRVVVATPGEAITLGDYDVTLVEAEHCPPDRFPGVISAPVTPPVKTSAPSLPPVVVQVPAFSHVPANPPMPEMTVSSPTVLFPAAAWTVTPDPNATV